MKIFKATKNLEYFACKSRFIFWLSGLYYKGIIRREAKLANITKDDNILCVGGGPCPFTAILLHKITGAQVTVIDNDISCLDSCKAFLQKNGYHKHIKAVMADGAAFSSKDFTIVHFAAQVTPFENVFNHIKNQSLNGTKLLVRIHKKKLSKLYSIKDTALFDGHDGVRHALFNNLDKTVLYVKAA